MGWITKIIILALIIGALMYFAPDTSHKAKDWLVDQAKNLSLDNFKNSNETFYCLNDEDCTNHFGFKGLICNNNTCAIGEQNGLGNQSNTTTQ